MFAVALVFGVFLGWEDLEKWVVGFVWFGYARER